MSYTHRPKVCEMRYVNVPIELLQAVKDDGLQYSLVCLSVALKCFSPSSTYRFTTLTQFSRDFHLGKGKAKRLAAAIRAGHPLFRHEVNHEGQELITARSLRRLYGHWITLRGGRRSLAMSVIKATLQDKEQISLKTIGRELRLLLLALDVNSKARADELQSKGLPLTGASAHAARVVLSVPYLAKAVGRSPRTVIRMTQLAERLGWLRAVHHPLVRVCDDMLHSADYVREGIADRMLTPELYRPASAPALIQIGRLGFERRCNDYQLLTWELRHRFQHIIYSHRRRLTQTFSLRKGQTLSQSELHELYD